MYRRVTGHPERDDEGHGEGRRESLEARNGLGLCRNTPEDGSANLGASHAGLGRLANVRCWGYSGHCGSALQCPLLAISGHLAACFPIIGPSLRITLGNIS